MNKIALLVLVICFTLNSSVSKADTDYKYINGNVIRWRERNVSVCIKKSALSLPDIRESVEYAMDIWSSIPSSPKLHFATLGESCKISIEMSSVEGNWDFKPLAINTISAYRYGGIDISEIVINKFFERNFGDLTKDKNVYDLRSVIVHEMGHALGLEEEYQDRYSIMYEKFKIGYTIKRKLKGADIRSINGLYDGVKLLGD